MGGAISEQVVLGCKRHPESQPEMVLMMDCYLELLAEINSFVSKLFLLRLFYHSNRKQTKTITTDSN